MGKFVFDELVQEDIDRMARSAKVFNLSRDAILAEKVLLASVDDEQWGSSEEKLDVAVWDNANSVWTLLKLCDKIEGYNEIPLGFVLEGQAFSRVLVIIRRMSTFVTDKTSYGQVAYIYSVVSDSFSKAVENPVFLGKMAQNQVYLDGTPKQVYHQIRRTVEDKEKQRELVNYIEEFLRRNGVDLDDRSSKVK